MSKQLLVVQVYPPWVDWVSEFACHGCSFYKSGEVVLHK